LAPRPGSLPLGSATGVCPPVDGRGATALVSISDPDAPNVLAVIGNFPLTNGDYISA